MGSVHSAAVIAFLLLKLLLYIVNQLKGFFFALSSNILLLYKMFRWK